MTTNAKKINISDYINPADDVLAAIEDVMLFYQLTHQDTVKAFEKWKGKTHYRGTMQEYSSMSDFRELVELNKNKPWEPIIKSIWLLEHANTQIDLNELLSFKGEDRQECFKLLMNGIDGIVRIKSWLSTLLQTKNATDAIYAASQLKMGVGKYIDLQVLKIGKIRTPSKEKHFSFFNDILEIQNPEQLAEYLKSKKSMDNCLILAFQRNPYYEFKLTVIMFVTINGVLYSIDMGERRLNIANTAGLRNPMRYIDREYTKVWLPFDMVLNEEGKAPKREALAIPHSTVYKIGTFDDIYEKTPECIFWLSIILLRAADYVSNTDVEEAYTSRLALKMLEDKTVLPVQRIKSESQSDASTYLVKRYSSQIKSITPSQGNLVSVLGTKDYVTRLIDYERRKELAVQLGNVMVEDWKLNHEKTFNWFVNFVKSHDINDIVQRAIQDKAYPRMFYLTTFGDYYIDGKRYEHEEVEDGVFHKRTKRWVVHDGAKQTLYMVNGKPFEGKNLVGLHDEHVLAMIGDKGTFSSSDIGERVFAWTSDGELWNGKYYTYATKHACSICGKFRWKVVVCVTFKDYRQLCAFFGVKPKDIDANIVTHLHQQNESAVGNSILDDVDPMDNLTDPWFRKHYEHSDYNFDTKKNDKRDSWDGIPELGFMVPLCGFCLTKLKSKTKKVVE